MMVRNRLRQGIRAVQRGEPVPKWPQDGKVKNLYIQDTVLPIPKRADQDDETLMRAVAEAVMEVVRAGDAYEGRAREDFITTNLEKIKSDPRFTGTPEAVE